MKWTTEDDNTLRHERDCGASFSQAAGVIGCTRGAAIGRAHRLGMRGERKKAAKVPRVRRRSTPIIPDRLVVGKHDAAPVPIHDQAIPVSQRRSVLDLTDTTCRWPVGEVGQPGFFFCGAPADLHNAQPYCQHHTKRSVNPSRGLYVPGRVLAA